MTIVALGDSLVAGYGLAGVDAFPSRLQQALADKGFAVTIVNAGVSGDTASGGLARFRGRHIGIVFQSFHLVSTMTALENVAVPLELASNSRAFARAAEELAAVGLADRLNHYPAQLSGGEQQRVALARALAPRPEILIADEPTGNLDETTGNEIIDLMFTRFQAQAMTLVLVTHDASLAGRCGRMVRLRSGHVEQPVAAAGSGQ